MSLKIVFLTEIESGCFMGQDHQTWRKRCVGFKRNELQVLFLWWWF